MRNFQTFFGHRLTSRSWRRFYPGYVAGEYDEYNPFVTGPVEEVEAFGSGATMDQIKAEWNKVPADKQKAVILAISLTFIGLGMFISGMVLFVTEGTVTAYRYSPVRSLTPSLARQGWRGCSVSSSAAFWPSYLGSTTCG